MRLKVQIRGLTEVRVKEQRRSGLKRLLEGVMEGELMEKLNAGWYRGTESR